jgi:tetratricopeptide (TPR) repeat protein
MTGLSRTHRGLRWGLLRLCAQLVVPLGWLAALTPAFAAILDEPEGLIEGSDAVVRVHFDVRVQYQRHAPTGTADLVEVFFQIVGPNLTLSPGVQEQVKTPEHDRVPAVTITYPIQPDPGNLTLVKRITVQFSRRVTFKVRGGPTDQSIDLVFPGLAGVAPPVSGAAGAVEKDRYAITLQTVPLDKQDDLRPVPGRFQDYTVFTTRGWRAGTAVVELDLGYFDTKAEADKIRQSALRDFPEASVFDLIERKEQNLAKAAEAPAAPPSAPAAPPPPTPPPLVPEAPPPAVAPITEAAPPAPEAPDTEIDKQARALLDRARSALASGNNEDAINLLNQLLLLPPNKFSQDAQELIGVARERAGQSELARKEYELYLKLFPNGEGATRVRQRLASLAPPPAQVTSEATTAATPPPQAPKYGVSGSWSQYYYGGQTQVNTTFLNTPTTVNQQSLSSTSQSSLVSTVNLNGRYQDGSNDARLVLFDTSDKSFIGGAAPGTNRLDSAYVDYRNTSYGFSAKVGRQAGVTGGLIGRFDGAIVGYDLSPQWRLNVAGGIPVDTIVNTNQNFEGMYLEAQNILEHWGGDAFFMNQMADGVTDRRAIGGDLRYFDSARTLYTMLDYDILFLQLNAVTVQGTWQLPDQTMFSLLFDDRKAPELLTSNALITTGASSITQLEQGIPDPLNPGQFLVPPLTLSQIRDLAKQTTATSKQFSLSVTRPLGSQWQASIDGRLTNVGALPFLTVSSAVAGVSNTIPAQPGTGNVYTADLQVNGTNLYSLRDINSFTYSWLHGPQFTGNQVGYANLSGLLENRITIEPSLRYYNENDTNGNRLSRITPALRATYKVLKRLTLESQVLYERSRTDGPTQNDVTSNVFYYIGYRYDFQ